MKIVQSFWSLPTQKKTNFNEHDRNKGGWLDKKFNFMSWSLSCLQFVKFYDKVELITDRDGYELLINKLKLPYTSIKVELDNINHYHPDLWALGKIYAYGIQDEPFIHADGDVFIFDKFTDNFVKNSLIAQNKEYGLTYYSEIFNSIKENFEYIPEILNQSINQNNGEIIASNAGIIGGNNYTFFKEFKDLAFKFIDENVSKLETIKIGMFNIIFEQFLFNALANSKEIPVNYFFDNPHQFDGIAEFFGTPHRVKYVHTLAYYKQIDYISDILEKTLLINYPEQYFRIINLLHNNEI